MFRSTLKIVVLTVLVVGAALATIHYRTSRSLEAQLEQEQQRSAELKQIVSRLTSERRVADVIVTSQDTKAGQVSTSIIFVEYAPDGSPLPAKHFTIAGNMAHIDAMVIKFDGRFVAENDALKGHSIALFTRLFGEGQAPAQGFPIDPPGQIPPVYQSANQAVTQFEQELWSNFWRLADDADYRNAMGVRVAQGEGVWRPFEPGRLYTITLESNGGLNVHSEPLKGIFQEALRSRGIAG
ncbi:MAG TPA: hypothetical protein VIM11_18030 [Tepidisphaeraceae bacterium]|jgi:hypothetical protein